VFEYDELDLWATPVASHTAHLRLKNASPEQLMKIKGAPFIAASDQNGTLELQRCISQYVPQLLVPPF
jgi:hypothetical protein